MAKHRTTVLLECPTHGVQDETDQPPTKSVFHGPFCRRNVAIQGYFYCGRKLEPRRGIVEVLDV